jgi:hypothetical protein
MAAEVISCAKSIIIYNLWITYDFAIAGVHGFRVGAGLSYNGMTFGSTANNVWIPSSTVVDAMFGYHAPHWDAEVGIKKHLTSSILHHGLKVPVVTSASRAHIMAGSPGTIKSSAGQTYATAGSPAAPR